MYSTESQQQPDNALHIFAPTSLMKLFMWDRSVGKFKASFFAFGQVTGFVSSPPSQDRLRPT
jgi:hypothetical protein